MKHVWLPSAASCTIFVIIGLHGDALTAIASFLRRNGIIWLNLFLKKWSAVAARKEGDGKSARRYLHLVAINMPRRTALGKKLLGLLLR